MSLNQTFPGVYNQVTDNSQLPAATSLFVCGLIGVASRGPFDTPTALPSLTDSLRIFGQKIGPNNLLQQTVALMAAATNGIVGVRVGARYTSTAVGNASGNKAQSSGAGFSSIIVTPQANLFSAGEFVRISQPGKATTVNAPVFGVSGSNVQLAVTLADSYTAANVDAAANVNAANKAESFLSALTYTTVGAYTVTGTKSAYVLTVVGAPTSGTYTGIVVGDTIKINQTGRVTTREATVAQLILASGSNPGQIILNAAYQSSSGQAPVGLQDSYIGATLSVATRVNTQLVNSNVVHLLANTEGTWANTTATTGLMVKVAPGSLPDTKQLQVYSSGTLVEQIDNLTFSDPTLASYAPTVVNGNSANILVDMTGGIAEPPANTISGWAATATPINTAIFAGGFDGENTSAADYIGTIDPVTEIPTGLKIFSGTDAEYDLNVSLVAITDIFDATTNTIVAIAQEGVQVALGVNAFYAFSVPAGLNLRQATDWHNGAGLYNATGGLINAYSGGVFWNHAQIVDPFDGTPILLPPHLAFLINSATSYNAFRPWYAVAGLKRGVLSYATGLQFPRSSDAAKQASYGNGQAINSILKDGQNIVISGNRTLQRTESKLSAINNVILVNYLVRQMSIVGKQWVFDPNDPLLLSQMNEQYTIFLDGVKNSRGIDGYSLVIDSSNNPPAVRNARKAVVNVQVIPIDAMEILDIYMDVEASGATLTSVQPLSN